MASACPEGWPVVRSCPLVWAWAVMPARFMAASMASSVRARASLDMDTSEVVFGGARDVVRLA
jgi:hypothetical protein